MAANSDIPAGIKDPNVDFNDTFDAFHLTKYLNSKYLKKFHFASSSAIYGDHGSLKIKKILSTFSNIKLWFIQISFRSVLSSFIEKNNCKIYIYRFQM